MIELDRPYRHPRSGVEIRVLRNDPDGYEMEITMPAGLPRRRPHVHFDFDQSFAVVSGRAGVTVGDETRLLAAGEEMLVPRGAAHADAWPEGDEAAVVRNRLWPRPPFIEALAETTLTCLEDGRCGDSGDLPLLHLAVIQSEAGGRTYAADKPIWLQRLLLPLLAMRGRRQGYRVERGTPV